jgi:hypothetical protein
MGYTTNQNSLVEQELVLDNDYHGEFNITCFIKVLGNGWKFKYNLKSPFSVKTNESVMIPANCPFSIIQSQPGSKLPIEITTSL